MQVRAAAYGGLILLILAVSGLLWRLPAVPAPPQKPQAPRIITHSTNKPSEAKPSTANLRWRGSSSQPKYIQLPTVKAEGMVQWVGVDQHRAVAVPNNIHMAGWYTNSQPPGEQGLSIIDGHVDGPTTAGIFKNLGQLQPNDRFSVTYSDNSQKIFAVHKVLRVPATDTAGVLFSQEQTIRAQLNLITCGGRYDKAAGGYQDRIIVIAERL